MSLPDTAEYWEDIKDSEKKTWHALPPQTKRPRLAKFESPHTIPMKTRCGLLLSYGQIAPKGTSVNCPSCQSETLQDQI